VSGNKKQIEELAKTLQTLITSVLTPIVNATKSISEHDEIAVPEDLRQRIDTLSGFVGWPNDLDWPLF
jgi:hypothetical protein